MLSRGERQHYLKWRCECVRNGTLIVELMDERNLWDDIEVISIAGVTSFLATASRIGAPVSQDFAIISLSDKLTDIDVIDKRVRNCFDADMVLGIYNPNRESELNRTKIPQCTR